MTTNSVFCISFGRLDVCSVDVADKAYDQNRMYEAANDVLKVSCLDWE
jgi:hypothetical protein